MQLRARLCWQPVFGGGLRIGWFETLGLTVNEAIDLAEQAARWHKEELEAAFKG